MDKCGPEINKRLLPTNNIYWKYLLFIILFRNRRSDWSSLLSQSTSLIDPFEPWRKREYPPKRLFWNNIIKSFWTIISQNSELLKKNQEISWWLVYKIILESIVRFSVTNFCLIFIGQWYYLLEVVSCLFPDCPIS